MDVPEQVECSDAHGDGAPPTRVPTPWEGEDGRALLGIIPGLAPGVSAPGAGVRPERQQ